MNTIQERNMSKTEEDRLGESVAILRREVKECLDSRDLFTCSYCEEYYSCLLRRTFQVDFNNYKRIIQNGK